MFINSNFVCYVTSVFGNMLFKYMRDSFVDVIVNTWDIHITWKQCTIFSTSGKIMEQTDFVCELSWLN